MEYQAVSIEDVSKPPHDGFYHVVMDWWFTSDMKGNIFFARLSKKDRHPHIQANSDPRIVDIFVEKGWNPRVTGKVQLPIAYLPHDCSNYD
jgi:hypothetical protein